MDDKEQTVEFGNLSPSRDLWADIEARIEAAQADDGAPSGGWGYRRMGWASGMAASLALVTVVTVMEQLPGGASPTGVAPTVVQTETLSGAPRNRDLASTFEPGLASLASAEHQVQQAIALDPDNRKLARMLTGIQHRRTNLLINQLKTRNET